MGLELTLKQVIKLLDKIIESTRDGVLDWTQSEEEDYVYKTKWKHTLLKNGTQRDEEVNMCLFVEPPCPYECDAFAPERGWLKIGKVRIDCIGPVIESKFNQLVKEVRSNIGAQTQKQEIKELEKGEILIKTLLNIEGD